ncbi:beta strand repeat-containing protein [Hymenobacter sp. CRA2]|uniref:beta strand repeat-containing protein n=1 Tax=Hymenobacter sp. CRA2 TaxID=1955620 RepID=UPI0009CB2828|nr:right-handed parallel beta-helix repeat-containing protein [Hymenobacter sp. CRA2]OON67850.1 hypothetical protein B0919_16860 [Hymenobacter sp. CRA2]
MQQPLLSLLKRTLQPRLAGALLAALLAGSPAAGWAQTASALSGAYTINSAQPTGGTNFATFAAAAAALNTNGVSGPVTFTVSGGPFNEQFSLSAIAGTSATNRVTINGGGRTIQFGSSTSAQRAVITLSGADYVTIDNLLVDATVGGTSTATYGWGIQLLGGADNNTISNCTVTSSLTSTSTTNFAGIVANNSTTSPTTGGNAGSNLTLENNTIVGGYYGIKIVGTSSAVLGGYRVRGNTVRDFYSYGLDADYTSSLQLIGNDIHRATRPTVSTFYGMSLGTGNVRLAIEKNRIHNPFTGNPSSTSAAYGVYLSGSDAPSGSENELINNAIYNFDGFGTEYGFYNSSSDNARYYHNTVALDNAASASGSNSYGFYQTTSATGIQLRNNVFTVRRGGSGSRYALYFSTAASTISSDYNDLLVDAGPNYFTGYAASTGYATLANWKTAVSGAYDQNSVAADPAYTAPATGNLQPTAASLNNVGTPLTRVTDDITGAARSATPDLGAYEFVPGADDAAVVSIDSPASPVVAGPGTVTVTVLNNGLTPLTSVQLSYVLNGGAAVTQTFTLSTPLAAGATRALTFSTTGTLVAGTNTLTVTAALPNGQPDANASNNTQSINLYTPLAGTYTIDHTQPASLRNFTTVAAAAAHLSGGGVSAPVRINVLNGPYTDQFAVGVIPGVSAADTVVIDGGANKERISYSGAAGQAAVVLLNGSDYVTLQNLTLDASAGTTAGIGVQLVGQADHNRIRNCVISGSAAATSSSTAAGIAASGSIASVSTAGNANDLRIENNVISGGYYGVVLTGASTTNRATGNRIIGNEIRDFYTYGVDVESNNGARIVGNNIHRSTRTGVTTFYGVYLVGDVATAVEGNRIHEPFTGNTASTSSAYGVYLSGDATAGAENDVVNNLIYDFNGSGIEYGLYNTTADNARYYHNTVVLSNAATSTSSSSYGFYQSSQSLNLDVRNNIFVVTRGGSGTRYALYYSTTTSTITSDYNDLVVGTSSTYYTGRFGTANFSTLANWKTANSAAFDQRSFSIDPAFAAAATGNFQPTAVLLNGAGTTLARVTRDINNNPRNNPPTPGAYEASVMANDVAVISIDAPATPAALGNNPVVVTIRNTGNAVLTSVTLSYALTGGTPTTQTFTGLTLAAGSNLQLTFTTPLQLPTSGDFTLTVTASQPNGQPDGNASNNTQTVTFNQPTPPNDEPCAALSLASGSVTASNGASTTSTQAGINLPACSPSNAPKDVWFTFTATGTSQVLNITGDAAGMVRVFRTASCSAGPFTQVFCQASGTANTTVGNVTVNGLTSGQLYYVAVSGYASSDATGTFTISTTVLSTRGRNSTQLAVFPNPSNTGQLTLRLAAQPATAGTVELLNALGQTVRRQALTTAREQQVSTTGLTTGLYTLRVQAGRDTYTQKVVLE